MDRDRQIDTQKDRYIDRQIHSQIDRKNRYMYSWIDKSKMNKQEKGIIEINYPKTERRTLQNIHNFYIYLYIEIKKDKKYKYN